MLNPNYTLEKRIQAETVSFSGEFGVYANDLRGNAIGVRADEPFETASCIKAFILADLYRQVGEGKKNLSDRLTYTAENQIEGSGILQSLEVGTELSVKNLATLMIIVSDNIATNILIDYLGLSHINETICGLGLTRTELFNKIDFERYDRLGTTTPREYGSLFKRICERKLISPDASDEMLSIFRKQHYNNMLVREFPQNYLDSENSDAGALIQTASKSGSMDACRNDGGIITTPYGSYVAVLFTKKFHDPFYYPDHESTRFGAKVSRLLLDQYLALEGRFLPEPADRQP